MRWWQYVLIVLTVVVLGLFFINRKVKKHTHDVYTHSLKQAPYDVIIVPGIPYDTAHVNDMFSTRILWAKNLYDRGITKNIIFSGGAVHSPYIEAMCMMLVADSLGLPVQHIYCEVDAQHSKDNVYYGWILARKQGFKKIAVATDAFQSLYLEKFMAKNLPDIALLPLDVDSMKNYIQKLPVINPGTAFTKTFVPLNERESWYTRIKNANGLDMPPTPPDNK